MGGVNFSYLVRQVGLSNLTFSDALTSGTPNAGPNWDFQITYTSSTMVGNIFDQALNLGVGGLTWGSAVNLNLGFAMGFPVPVNNAAILARSSTAGQFAQFRFKLKAGGANTNIMVFVMGSFNETCYGIIISNADGGVAQLFRYNGNFAASTNLGAIGAYVVNDTLRIEARVISAATVELRCYINGGLLLTINDSTGSRLTSGRAGIALIGASANTTMSVDQYSGGSL